ncbi:MAG: NTP transferase domain-containing protein [Bacteroidetes bacterium]|nr:NTP transferase domain-containing protein [Bacteroidota bacterium]
MKLIIPMAGMGKRMRPHTLTTPKPLLPVAGKPIVHWLIEDIAEVCGEPIDEIGFVTGQFGPEIEQQLLDIATSIGAKGHIHYQDEPEGTAHAILCARQCLKGDVIVAFADTLFRAKFHLDKNHDGVIWVHHVENPSSFGVVKLNDRNVITDFVEKPTEFVSDLAIIGIYYFKSGETLEKELQYLIDNNVREKGEYQLTNALENMKNKGMEFVTGAVEEWWDCGNKDATVNTNRRLLETRPDLFSVPAERFNGGTRIIEPCFIGENVKITGSTIGPFVSIGDNTVLENCTIANSIIQNNSKLLNLECKNSMIGNHVLLDGKSHEFSIGDYSTLS